MKFLHKMNTRVRVALLALMLVGGASGAMMASAPLAHAAPVGCTWGCHGTVTSGGGWTITCGFTCPF